MIDRIPSVLCFFMSALILDRILTAETDDCSRDSIEWKRRWSNVINAYTLHAIGKVQITPNAVRAYKGRIFLAKKMFGNSAKIGSSTTRVASHVYILYSFLIEDDKSLCGNKSLPPILRIQWCGYEFAECPVSREWTRTLQGLPCHLDR